MRRGAAAEAIAMKRVIISSSIGLSLLVVVLLVSVPILVSAQTSDQIATVPVTTNNTLSAHWVKDKGYRDELNSSDIDYQNFWTDNAGKILVSSELTNDTLDANNSLWFLEHNGLGNSGNYYLPETVVNSSLVLSLNGGAMTNRIAMLQATNSSSSKLEQLGIGSYYAGEQILAYVGSDRLLFNGVIYRASNSTVFETTDGFVKRSLFVTPSGQLYVYLNATLAPGAPYANVSIQVLPLNTSTNSSDILYLQIFSWDGQFDNASLYDGNGNYQKNLAYNNGSPATQNGTIITYSKLRNVFGQDSVALSFSGNTATSPLPVDDLEHWYQNAAFDGLSWVGVAYSAPQDPAGTLSVPVFSKLYPIEHLDYHLLNDTARYIALGNPNGTTVSPPVSFGFVAYGLALASSQNQSLEQIARGYWNYYYSRYTSHQDYSTPYARSINILALAGFKLYGCNSTVENFTRNFVNNTSGGSIEEFAWGVAALYQLEKCTSSPADLALYNSFSESLGTSKSNFATLDYQGGKKFDLNAASTFQFAETASALMLGGVPYNDPVVLASMDAVYQSSVSGTLLNQPFKGDLANTETIPSILLATTLFQTEMKADTGGYWISGLHDANVTSINHSKNGSLTIGVFGRNGAIEISSLNSSSPIVLSGINGFVTEPVTASAVPTSTTTSIITTTATQISGYTSTTTTIINRTTTTTVTSTIPTSTSISWVDWLILASSVALFLVGSAFLFVGRKARRR